MKELKVSKDYNKTRELGIKLGKLHAKNESEKVRGYIA